MRLIKTALLLLLLLPLAGATLFLSHLLQLFAYGLRKVAYWIEDTASKG